MRKKLVMVSLLKKVCPRHANDGETFLDDLLLGNDLRDGGVESGDRERRKLNGTTAHRKKLSSGQQLRISGRREDGDSGVGSAGHRPSRHSQSGGR